MVHKRIIPVLLISDGGLVKGVKYKKHKYVGDPMNAVRIFNEKEVDELVFLDISVRKEKRSIDFELLRDIASEAFMPFAYGGGIDSVGDVEKLFTLGIEKVILNSVVTEQPTIVQECSSIVGAQSVVVAIDVKKTFRGGYEVYSHNATKRLKIDPVQYAKTMQDAGAGELLVSAVDRDGTGLGYDIDLIESVVDSVDIPVVGACGAGSMEHIAEVFNKTHVSACAAGDMFVYHGARKAVLITYPNSREIEAATEGK